MYFTYILKSIKDGRWYTGATADLRKRFKEHQDGYVFATKGRGPFTIIYYEACSDERDAFTREKYLKSGGGKRYLKNRLKRFLSLTGQGMSAARRVSGRSPRATVATNRGFIALISALIISAILITLVFSVSTSSFYARFDSLNGENKRISLGLAESCVNAALLALATSTAPSTYSPVNQVIQVGTDSIGRAMNCTVQSIVHNGSVATIDVQAQWQGSYSNVTARATIPDPSVGNAVPPPTCALTASPSTVPQGQPVLLQWSTLNSSAFSLDHSVGNQTNVGTGSYSLTASGVGSVTYVGTATGPGGSSQCSTTFTVSAPPPNPACADTMMIFDRSGSLNATDRANVKAAASQLIDLYAGVTAFHPLIGAGFFGARADANSAEIPVDAPNNGLLGINYLNLKSTVTNLIDSALGTNGSNLAAGMNLGWQELGSVRHDTTRQKVLIFVSDGEPNRAYIDGTCPSSDPSASLLCQTDRAKANQVNIFTVQYTHQANAATAATARALLAEAATGNVSYASHANGAQDNSVVNTDTGWLYPTATHAPNTWTGNTNAFTDDTTYTTDSVNNDAQGYANFNVSVPAGVTVTGIEARVKGMLSAVLSGVNTPQLAPTGDGNFTGWLLTGAATKSAAVATNDADTSYITTNANNAQTFVVPSAAVPAGSTVNSVTVWVVARQSSGSGQAISIRAENGVASAFDNAPNVLTGTAYQTLNRTMTTNPATNAAWTVADVNTWGLKFGVNRSAGTGVTRVTQVYVVVNYTPAVATNCTVDTDISWNNGTTFSTKKPVVLNATETSLTPTGNTVTDTWGHTWNSSTELTNANLVLRLTNNSCTGGTLANINAVSLKIHYSGMDPTVENNDGDSFFITPDTSNPASIQTIFDTIGKKVCPAAAAKCANGIDDDGDGLVDTADPQCHTDGNAGNSASYSSTINDEYQPPAPPGPPSAPPPPPSVDVGSWQEIPQ